MSPEERAEFVLKKLHGRIIVSECNTRLIAQAIRQAENEAIERCAVKAERFPAAGRFTHEGFKPGPNTPFAIAHAIRSLATKDP